MQSYQWEILRPFLFLWVIMTGGMLKKCGEKKMALAKEKATLKARIEKLPNTFNAAMCGEVGAKSIAARVLCLERLKMHSPKLDLEREVVWEQ